MLEDPPNAHRRFPGWVDEFAFWSGLIRYPSSEAQTIAVARSPSLSCGIGHALTVRARIPWHRATGVVAARTVSEVPSPCALGEPDPEPRQSVAGTPDPDRRGSARRRRHARQQDVLVLISVLILPVSLLWAASISRSGRRWLRRSCTSRSCWTAIVVFSRTGTSAGSCLSARSPSCWLRRCR